MSKINKTTIVKIAITVVSLIIFLSLLEAGLRIGGYYHLSRRRLGYDSKVRDEAVTLSGKEGYTILCLGDSYTYGGDLSHDKTYPFYLQAMLADKYPYKKYQVINGGVCEHNSRQLLACLPDLIKRYKPDMVIIMIGAANRFNFALYDMYGASLMGVVRSLRIYKMFKFIRLNLKEIVLRWARKINRKMHRTYYAESDFGFNGFISVPEMNVQAENYFEKMGMIKTFPKSGSPYEKVWFYYNTGKIQEALALCKSYLKANPDSTEILCIMAYIYYQTGDTQEAARLYSKVYQKDLYSRIAILHLAYFYYELCTDFESENIEDCCKAIRFNPCDGEVYFCLGHAYSYQSKYKASYVFELLRKLAENEPSLKDNALFSNHYSYFQNQNKWEEEINKWLKQDSEKIVNFCQKKDIKVVIQNYPYFFSIANKALKEIAVRHCLLFVDNRSAFEELLIDGNLTEYFLDDMHCTARGYRSIAENIYRIIVSDSTQ